MHSLKGMNSFLCGSFFFFLPVWVLGTQHQDSLVPKEVVPTVQRLFFKDLNAVASGVGVTEGAHERR